MAIVMGRIPILSSPETCKGDRGSGRVVPDFAIVPILCKVRPAVPIMTARSSSCQREGPSGRSQSFDSLSGAYLALFRFAGTSFP